LQFLTFANENSLSIENNNIPYIEHLDISSCAVNSILGNNFSSLKNLNASNNALMGTFQQLLIPKIQNLDLSGNSLINFNHQNFPELLLLDVSSNNFLSTFENVTVPKIKTLLLDHNLITDFSFNSSSL
jgi:hypothetical protein